MRPRVVSGSQLFLTIFGATVALATAVYPTLSRAAATAGCLPASSKMPQEKIDAFQKDPKGILIRSPLGEGKLAAEIRNLAASGGDTSAGLSKVIVAANSGQIGAIGAGLGQAALLCRKGNPDAARHIQELVIGADRRDLLVAFQSVVQEQLTSATSGDSASSSDAPDAPESLNESTPGGGPNPGSDRVQAAGSGSSPLLAFFATSRPGGSSSSRSLFTTNDAAFQSTSPSR